LGWKSRDRDRKTLSKKSNLCEIKKNQFFIGTQ
jgi:hypothetical protein